MREYKPFQGSFSLLIAPVFQHQTMGETTLVIYNNLGLWAHHSRTIASKFIWRLNSTVVSHFSPYLCIFIFYRWIPLITPTLLKLCLTLCLTNTLFLHSPLSSKPIFPDSLHCSSISLFSAEVSFTSVSQEVSSIVKALLSTFGLLTLYFKLSF